MKKTAVKVLKPSWRPSKMKQRYMPLLAVASLSLLTSCENAPTNKAYCPIPIYPDKCAIDWYERADTPQCFDDFMDRYMRQQQTIEKNCGK